MDDDDLVVPGMLVHHEVERALDEYKASLRADVSALIGDEWADRRPVMNGYRHALRDVLDLIDGISND